MPIFQHTRGSIGIETSGAGVDKRSDGAVSEIRRHGFQEERGLGNKKINEKIGVGKVPL
jgi:hypothetical protein